MKKNRVGTSKGAQPPPSYSNRSAATVRITADYRERASGIPTQLEPSPFVDLRFKQLAVGDYIIDDRVIIERKSGTDFSNSIVDGRLFRQASKLLASPFHSALIIEGPVENTVTGVSRESIQGALISLTLIFDIPVLRAADKTETAQLLIYAAKQLGDLDRQARPFFNARQPKTTKGKRLRLLQALPGIGPNRAKELLTHFGTIERCLQASKADLCTLPGIGPKTATAIRNLVEGD